MQPIASGSQRYLFIAGSLLAALLGCGSGSVATSPPPTTPPVVPPTSSAKTPIKGLVAMGNEGFNNHPGLVPVNDLADPIANPDVYSAAVILVTWKQLQPNGSASFDTSAIDAALASIAIYNSTHTKSMLGKLRIFAGQNSPAWALTLDGPPVTGSVNGATVTLPRYWTASYTAAWKNLQVLLAAKYDTDAEIGEVAVSGCSSTTAEPFIHAIGSDVTPLLQAAGYTDEQYMACLTSMGDQYSAWTQTPLDYTFNTFNGLDSGKPISNSAFTLQVATAWRSTLGTARGVIANHGLQPTLTPDALAIYPVFTSMGPPIEFQSYGPTVDWNATVALAVSYKCSELEIWTTTQAGGQASISLAQLQSFASQI